MCVISITCWKGIDSPTLIPSPTMLKDFNGNTFQPHGIILFFSIELRGKTIEIKVEVIDALIDYNILLDHSWKYAMEDVVSSIYIVIKFPHRGRIVTIDQLSFCHRDSVQVEPNIPMVGDSMKKPLNVGVSLYSSLMGTFSVFLAEGNMISCVNSRPLVMKKLFKTSYISNPWNLPNLRHQLEWICLCLQHRFPTKKCKRKL